jgi:hypothetical protein
MSIGDFIKKLLILDVIFGKRSKMIHGIKDGGTLATSINDESVSRIRSGNSIFNLDNSINEPYGGHFHGGPYEIRDMCHREQIEDGEDAVIPIKQQYILSDAIIIDGTLTIDGTLVVI